MRRNKRIRRRFYCQIQTPEKRRDGIVMDLTEDGLFVLTKSKMPPGTQVEILLKATPDMAELTVRAIVVRHRLEREGSAQISSRGLGLRILEAPAAYYKLASEVEKVRDTEEADDDLPAVSPRRRFRVRVRQQAGSLFRMLPVSATSREDAKRQIQEELGPDWEPTEVLDPE